VHETIWFGVIGIWLSGLWVFFSPLRNMRDFSAWSEGDDTESAEAEPAQ